MLQTYCFSHLMTVCPDALCKFNGMWYKIKTNSRFGEVWNLFSVCLYPKMVYVQLITTHAALYCLADIAILCRPDCMSRFIIRIFTLYKSSVFPCPQEWFWHHSYYQDTNKCISIVVNPRLGLGIVTDFYNQFDLIQFWLRHSAFIKADPLHAYKV